jgi:tetratricopeptide (TPR) repeat protein
MRIAVRGAASICITTSILAICAAGQVSAAAAGLAEADREALIQGLQAQHEVALIRERKLADDRETQLIAALESRLKAARAAAETAKGDARQAREQLASARSDYAKLAAQITQRDISARSDIESYHAEAQTTAQQASPDMAAALQRFADGDRVGAWPIIQSLAAAQQAAPGATGASKAASIRMLADLRKEMRAHGEATTAEVLALYDQAATIDPSNFMLHLTRAELARDLGELTRARAAAQQAVSVASTEGERGLGLSFLGEQAAEQHDVAAAHDAYTQALAIFQRLAASDSTPFIQNLLGRALREVGDLQAIQGDSTAAKASYMASLAIRERLATADPSDKLIQLSLSLDLQQLGELDMKTGDREGAKSAFERGLAIRQELLRADPSNTDDQFFVTGMLRRLGDLARKQGDLKTARQEYEQCMAIRQRLSAANPSSALYQAGLALDYFDLADVAFEQNDPDTAKADYERSLAILQRLTATDPTNAELQQQVLLGMVRYARMPGASVTWQQVADQYEAIKKAGHLVPEDDLVPKILRWHHVLFGR